MDDFTIINLQDLTSVIGLSVNDLVAIGQGSKELKKATIQQLATILGVAESVVIGNKDVVPTDPSFAFAEQGVYPEWGNTEIEGDLGILIYDGVSFSKTEINFIASGVVEEGNTNAVSGEEVFKHVEVVNSKNLKYKVVSDNLVNEKSEDYFENAILASDGILYLDAPNGYEVSGFVPVEPNTKYTPNQKHNVCFYDLNQNYITGTGNSRPNLSFETPSKCLFVRLNSGYNGGQLKMVKGDLTTFPSNIDQYEIEIAEVDNVLVTIPALGVVEEGNTQAVSGGEVFKHVEVVNSKNLKYKVVSDNLVNEKSEDYLRNANMGSDGILYLDTPNGYEVSGFVPVEPNTKYTPNQKHNVCFYDLDQNYITGIDASRPTLSFETPSNCLFVRLNATYNGGQLKMVKGDLTTFPSGIDQYEIEIAEVDNVPVTIQMPDIPTIPTNVSAFNNDVGYATLSQVATAVSPLVNTTYLQANYQNKVENKNYVDAKIDGLIVGADNIENQSITEDKISVELFESLANGSPITINNNPDENDLTANGGVIELKDRSNYIYLKKGVNITQALVDTWVDKIVSIRHSHAITEDINFTSNITLQFDGGYFTATSAKKLNGGDCVIIADRYWIFRNIFTDPSDPWEGFTTKFKTEKSHPEWFGSGSDVNVLDCTCISICNVKFNAPIDLESGKTYVINKSLLGGSIRGNFATLKKNPISIDINVLSAIPTGGHSLVINVDSGSADFSKLKVGMQVEFVNKEGQARKVNLAFKVITDISGNQITLYGFSGGTSFEAGEAQMINCFKALQLGESEIIENLRIDGSRDAFTHNRTYWEFSQEIFISGYAKNVKIFNCFIENCQSEGITVGGNNTLVKGNIIKNCGGNGIHLSGSYNSKIDHNEIYDTNKKPSTGHNEGAITYSNEVYLTHITNNVFDGCLTGIGSIDAGFNSDSFITGNTFRRYKTHGIDMLSTTGGGNIVNNTIISNNRFCGKFLPKTTEANYLPTLENNFNESEGYSINLASNGYLLEGIVISGNVFECGSIFALNAEISLTGNTFTEKYKTFGSSFVKDVITLIGTTGIMSGNYIVSMDTNREAILNIDSYNQIGILSNTFKGENIKSASTTTDLTGNKVIQL